MESITNKQATQPSTSSVTAEQQKAAATQSYESKINELTKEGDLFISFDEQKQKDKYGYSCKSKCLIPCERRTENRGEASKCLSCLENNDPCKGWIVISPNKLFRK